MFQLVDQQSTSRVLILKNQGGELQKLEVNNDNKTHQKLRGTSVFQDTNSQKFVEKILQQSISPSPTFCQKLQHSVLFLKKIEQLLLKA